MPKDTLIPTPAGAPIDVKDAANLDLSRVGKGLTAKRGRKPGPKKAKRRKKVAPKVTTLEQAARELPPALASLLAALEPLDFDGRRTVLRWAAEALGIDPTKIGDAGYTPTTSRPSE